MRFKRLLALLLAAALALAVLVGCGSGQQSVASALLKLLDGKYPNISIEIDPDLEADLRQAISQAEAENAGDDAAAIRAALEKLVGSTVTFRNLGDGQQGDTTFDLVFYAGTDPDKAAQAAYSQWNIVFANVPDDGKYGTGLAMVETENGIWMLVKATVEKAGTVDKPDTDDDEPDEPEKPKEPYEVTMDEAGAKVTNITVGTSKGLSQILSGNATGGSEEEKNALTQAYNDGFKDVIIKLEPNTTYTVSQQFAGNDSIFKGTLQGADKKSTTITLTGSCNGLFQQIDSSGTVKDITFDVQTTITNTYESGTYTVVYAGAVAGLNYGTITNCDVKLNNSTIKIEEAVDHHRAGGIVGQNSGTITGCTVTGGTIQVECGLAFAGGIAGYNSLNGTTGGEITDCTVTGAIIKADGGSGAMAGGLVGDNNDGNITGSCKVRDTSVTAQTNSMGAFAGGLVGRNNSGTVTGTYTYTGSGTLTAKTGWEWLDEYYKYMVTVFVPNSENSYTNTVGDGGLDMAYVGTGIGCDFTSNPQGPQPADNHKTISP